MSGTRAKKICDHSPSDVAHQNSFGFINSIQQVPAVCTHRSTFRHATALHLPPHHRRSTSLHTMPPIPPNPPPLPHYLTGTRLPATQMPPLHSHITATSYCPTTAAPPQNSLSLTPPAAFTSSPRHPQPATTVTPAATHSQHLRCRYHQRL